MAIDKDFVVKNGIQVATTANVTGNINACSALTVAGITTLNSNVNVDGGTLFVDAVNNRVGISNTNPDTTLTVTGSANVSGDLKVFGNLVVSGTTQSVGNQIATGDIVPQSNSYYLGNTTNRWNLFGNNLFSDSSLSVGSNVVVNTSTIAVGNSTVNVTITSTEFNGYPAAYLNATTISTTLAVNTSINIGNSTVNTFVNSTSINVGSNVVVNTSTIRVGNSTSFANVTISGITTNGSLGVTGAATFANTVGVGGLTSLNGGINTTTANASIGVNVGANVNLSTTQLNVGNSSVNTVITSTAIDTDGTLSVLGNTTLSNTISVNGNASFSNTVAITGAVTLSNTLAVTGNATFSKDVIVSGNLIINGTTTTVNTQTLNVADNIITLNSDISGATAPTENAGIEVNRGSSANVFVRWNETTDAWEITNDGATYSNVVTVAYSGNADNITTGTLNTARLPATANISTALNVGANVNLTTTSINIGNSTVNVASNSSSFAVGAAVIANGSGVYTTGTVNASSHTVGTNFAANTVGVTHTGFGNIGTSLAVGTSTTIGTTLSAGNTTITGFVNVSDNVNSAMLTVGTNFIANTTGAYHTGTINAVSHTVGTIATTNGAIINSTVIAIGNSSVNSVLNSSSIGISTTFTSNATGVYTTGTVNASSYTVGTTFTANSTLVNATALNVVNQVNASSYTVGTTFTANSTLVNATALNVVNRVNTSTLYVTTSANVGTSVVANATGVYTTGTVNAFSFVANSQTYNTSLTGNGSALQFANTAVGGSYNIRLSGQSGDIESQYLTAYNSATVGSGGISSNGSLTIEGTSSVLTLSQGDPGIANTVRSTRIYGKNYAGNNLTSVIFYTSGSETKNILRYGGGTTLAEPVTEQYWYTNAVAIGETGNTGSIRLALISNGNFGVGTSSPTYDFQVVGNTSISGFVNASSHTVGTSFVVNTAGITHTGFANISGTLDVDGVLTAGANIALNNNHIVAPKLKSYKEYVDSATVTTAYTCNLANSNIFTLTGTNGSTCVFTFSNPPASGTAQMFTVVFKQPATGSADITWPASVRWSYGDTPVVSGTVNRRDVFTFMTFDGGTTYLGAHSMANVA